jgi:hypothetical protein
MACSSGGLVGGVADATYAFEVSNGGISDDADHDQIYYKKRSEEGPPNTFNRDVAYHGTHLLRCHVKSKATGQVAQDLFVVHGVHA